MNQASTPSVEESNGKAKINVEEVRNEMNQTWRKKSDGSSSSNGLGYSPTSN